MDLESTNMIKLTKRQENILKEAIDHYGYDNQLTILIEEMSELTKEICKIKRGIGDMDNLIEEYADVLIMMEQISMMFYLMDDLELEHAINYKIDRLKKRIEEEKRDRK